MVTPLDIFSGFSVNDLAAAKSFYGETLGLRISDGPMGNLDLELPAGGLVFIYPKDDHVPATFTILNLVVDDIDRAVDDLNAKGVATAIYDDPALPTDAKGVLRGRSQNRGPDIAWFRDPAGNVLSVLQE
ncbi:VOC family protein [Leifsonia shinshuensis]|uniref:VOC family protein n=1 Tax=Leifsonia shinshuensis TaxID=150026 RepID=UPI00285C813F|nr:VOC family protein [Leifsonia shinshuensis]MDR6970936.1 putative enzyme related to lactoylglutathione lyase [Leifsonia shinshuensis]